MDRGSSSALLVGLRWGAKPDAGTHALLSAVALADPALAKRFDEGGALLRSIDAGAVQHGVAHAFREQLSEFGDRGVQELNVERPNPRGTLWDLVRVVPFYARSSVTHEELRTSDRARRTEAEAQLATLLQGHPLRKRAVEAASDNASLFKGIGSSAGIVEGTARIVLDPGAVGTLGKDDILIAKETDPGWLF
ncbi:hypothetical protein [Corallococcus sp. AB011P]|uniref:hypothetical protein n=1 Tax=Corallococcus sp. AB011P TaxID=2316735 RepID=UPI001F415CE6|nr:hypothetical protein [Corallococcus sp. AB011P]